MLARCFLVCSITAACTAAEPGKPCDDRPVVTGGAVELGLGDSFTEVHNGQDVNLVLGSQGLWMFVVNARVADMDASAGEIGVLVDAVDVNGQRASLLDRGCRARQFADNGSGLLQLTTGSLMPLDPNAVANVDGATFTIRIEVRDVDGRRATDERTVVAHTP
ncbi:MAG: hypothetical protein ABIY55_25165 [Kofleriaceae bacterium]